jgi:hypothetical protein
VREAFRAMLADPQLTEARIPQGVSKRRATLLQDLLSVRHKEQTRSRQNGSQADEIHRCHHRLARPGRSHDQVSVMPTESGELHLLEQALLKRPKVKLGRRQFKSRAADVLCLLAEDDRVVWQEIATLPIRLEHRGHLGHHIRVAQT